VNREAHRFQRCRREAPIAVEAITPPFPANAVLPGAQFIDTYGVALNGPDVTARAAAERMMGRSPKWVARLMALRNRVVAPFGLRTPAWNGPKTGDMIGIFPVLSDTPGQLLVGFDDSHLDFRIIISVSATDRGRYASITTVVRKHNFWGHVYLASIMPFHKLIVRSILRQIQQ
jgi:hypothetical protein